MATSLVPSNGFHLDAEDDAKYTGGGPSGSPSKQRKRSSIRPTIKGIAAEWAKRRRCLIGFCCLLSIIVICICVVISVGVLKPSSKPESITSKDQQYNYSLCQLNWKDNSYANLGGTIPEDYPESTCSSFNKSEDCKVLINCCWVENACETYENLPECSALSSKSSCEANGTFCAWRTSLQECRRANREQENVTRNALEQCMHNWVPSKSRPNIPCANITVASYCSGQVGCCWNLEGSKCLTFGRQPECVSYKQKNDCESASNILRCLWNKQTSQCDRGDQPETFSLLQSAMATRFPTAQETLQPTMKLTMSPTRPPFSSNPTRRPSSSQPSTAPRNPTLIPSRAPLVVTSTSSPVLRTLSPTSTLAPSRSSHAPSSSSAVTTQSPNPKLDDQQLPIPHNKRKTSFLILLADDMGWGDASYISPTPYYSTKNIDAMAKSNNSLTMMRFHSAAISCSPTRSSLLSMRNNVRDCVWGANSKWDKPNVVFRPEFPFQGEVDKTLGFIAKQQGYKTLFLGKWHIGTVKEMPSWGFDYWTMSTGNLPTFDSTCFCQTSKAVKMCMKGHYPVASKLSPNYDCNVFAAPVGEKIAIRNETSSARFVNLFEKFMAGLAEQDSFFAVLAFNEPHIPFIASPWVRNELMKGTLKASADKSIAADYYGALLAMDDAVGKARQLLVQHDRQVDTFVLFASDNGPEELSMGGYGSTGGLLGRKRSLFEGGHRVPGIVEWPQYIHRNIMSFSPISMLDISATILDLLLDDDRLSYNEIVQQIDGESITSLLMNFTDDQQTFLFNRTSPIFMCSGTPSGSRRACESVAVIYGRMKLITGLQLSGAVNRSSAKLYDYEVSEATALPSTDPQLAAMISITDAWGRDVVGESVQRCKFPPADIGVGGGGGADMIVSDGYQRR